MNTRNIPEQYRYAVIPHLVINGAADAIRFYTDAFGADEYFRLDDESGRIVHAEISVQGSALMLGDGDGDGDGAFNAPGTAGTSVILHVYVADVDALTEQAVNAGAALLEPPTDMSYGARQAMLRDPYGHVWIFLTTLREPSLDQLTGHGPE